MLVGLLCLSAAGMVHQLGGPDAALSAVMKTVGPRSGFGLLKADDKTLPKKHRKWFPRGKAANDDAATAGLLPKPKAKAPPPSPTPSTTTERGVALSPASTSTGKQGRRKVGSYAKEALTNIKNKVVQRRRPLA